MPPKTPIVVNTLGALRQQRLCVYLECVDCGRKVENALPMLIERLGEEHSSLRADLPLVCSGCSSRRVSMALYGARH